ncbi:MAG: hypothetical protein RIR41_3321, partial [Pseudomonadota bacterium]
MREKWVLVLMNRRFLPRILLS